MDGSTSYYDRQFASLADGTRTFQNQDDTTNELNAKTFIEKAWNCGLHHYPRFHPIDWYAERDHRIVAHVELKTRTHESSRFTDVFFNLRKWLSLTLANVCTGLPSLFVVQFTDTIRYIDVAAVDARAIMIGGTNRIVKAKSDIEPVILVPIADMKEVS